MADLSYAELKRVWLTAAKGTRYESNAWASLMAAIAEAESSGDPNATNPTDNGGTQTSWGLWQISNGTHTQVSSQWANPVVNAQLAIQKLDGTGLSAWGTYDSGAYKAYLNDGTSPSATIPATGGSAGQATATLTAAETAAAAANATTCALGFNQHIGIVFGLGPTVDLCFVQKRQMRAIMGGVFILSGGILALAGVAVLLVQTTGLDVGKLAKLAGRTQAAATQAQDATAARQARRAPARGRHAQES